MAKKITWRDGNRMAVKPEVAYQELEKIRRKTKLTPENVVSAARPQKAPLHPAFTWDDREAGELYRRYEARHLIRAIVVQVDDDSEPQKQYFHVTDADDGRYESVDVVVQSPSLYASALAELQVKVNAALAAANQLEQAAKGSDDSERLMKITLAVRAMETAAQAVRGLIQ